MTKRQLQAQPADRDRKKMSVFYVDRVGTARLSDLDPLECFYEVQDALSYYAGAKERLDNAGPIYGNVALSAAVSALGDRAPSIPIPSWPRFDSSLVAKRARTEKGGA